MMTEKRNFIFKDMLCSYGVYVHKEKTYSMVDVVINDGKDCCDFQIISKEDADSLIRAFKDIIDILEKEYE